MAVPLGTNHVEQWLHTLSLRQWSSNDNGLLTLVEISVKVHLSYRRLPTSNSFILQLSGPTLTFLFLGQCLVRVCCTVSEICLSESP